MKTFTASTIVRDREGRSHVFEAGQEAPDWVVDVISSGIIAEAGVPVETIESETASADADDESSEELSVGESESADSGAVAIPPVKGPGSSAAAWAAYAKSQGYEVDEDAKASEIREALAEAGVPVE